MRPQQPLGIATQQSCATRYQVHLPRLRSKEHLARRPGASTAQIKRAPYDPGGSSLTDHGWIGQQDEHQHQLLVPATWPDPCRYVLASLPCAVSFATARGRGILPAGNLLGFPAIACCSLWTRCHDRQRCQVARVAAVPAPQQHLHQHLQSSMQLHPYLHQALYQPVYLYIGSEAVPAEATRACPFGRANPLGASLTPVAPPSSPLPSASLSLTSSSSFLLSPHRQFPPPVDHCDSIVANRLPAGLSLIFLALLVKLSVIHFFCVLLLRISSNSRSLSLPAWLTLHSYLPTRFSAAFLRPRLPIPTRRSTNAFLWPASRLRVIVRWLNEHNRNRPNIHATYSWRLVHHFDFSSQTSLVISISLSPAVVIKPVFLFE